jgi:hypothetical protein
MTKITRRKAILLGGMGLLATYALSGCCFIRQLLGHPCDPFKDWKNEASNWWNGKKKQREKEKQDDISSGKRTKIELPKPYIDFPYEYGPHGSVAAQFKSNFHLNEWNDFYVMIRNKGNAPSWNCIVETYETPAIGYGLSFNEFKFNDRVIICLNPGESKEVKLRFKPTKPQWGGWLTRCYDPFCDPGLQTFEQYDRHNIGFGWEKWIN